MWGLYCNYGVKFFSKKKKFIILNDNFLMCYILMGNIVIDFIVEIFF